MGKDVKAAEVARIAELKADGKSPREAFEQTQREQGQRNNAIAAQRRAERGE